MNIIFRTKNLIVTQSENGGEERTFKPISHSYAGSYNEGDGYFTLKGITTLWERLWHNDEGYVTLSKGGITVEVKTYHMITVWKQVTEHRNYQQHFNPSQMTYLEACVERGNFETKAAAVRAALTLLGATLDLPSMPAPQQAGRKKADTT